MKKGDKVKINKPGIFSGAEGTISNIRYYVTLTSGYIQAFDEHELVLLSKYNSTTSLKTSPIEHGVAIEDKAIKKVAKAKAPKEVKVKRKYTKQVAK